MSDTKWRKLIGAVRDADSGLDRMTLKFIDVPEPSAFQFPPSLTCPRAYMDTIELGPVELRAIEWMELDGNWMESLHAIGSFPMHVRDGCTRITGYGNGAL